MWTVSVHFEQMITRILLLSWKQANKQTNKKKTKVKNQTICVTELNLKMHIFYAPTDTTFIDKLPSFIWCENEKLQHPTQIEIKQLHDREQIKTPFAKWHNIFKWIEWKNLMNGIYEHIFRLFCQKRFWLIFV